MANQFLGLSMFIMLLSFFIVLNSLSSFEIKKSNPILNSLSSTFSVEEPEDKTASSDEARTIFETQRKGTTLDQLQGLFEAEITGLEVSQNRLGTVMHMRMWFEEFDERVTEGLKAGNDQDEPFVRTLISLLDATESGTPTKMSMVVNLRSTPAVALSNGDTQLSDTTLNLSRLANLLERSGLPKKLISTGLKVSESPDEEGKIDLFFMRYEPFNPLVEKVREGT